MTTQHTPGPWTVKEARTQWHVRAGDRYVTAVSLRRNGREGEANARLIVAAPELLAAAESAANWLGEYEAGPDTGIHGLLAQLRAAIAKATGA